MKKGLMFCLSLAHCLELKAQPLRLYPGFVTKVSCQGKLQLSSIGNDQLVKLEALPKELGCGLVLKPLAIKGMTNLVLETSTGAIQTLLTLEVGRPNLKDLEIKLKGDEQGELK